MIAWERVTLKGMAKIHLIFQFYFLPLTIFVFTVLFADSHPKSG